MAQGSNNMRRDGERASPRLPVNSLLRLFEENARKSPETLAAIAPEVTDAVLAYAEILLRQQGCRNPEMDAAEVSQTWWVNMLEHGLRQYDPSRDFSPYAVAMARNGCRDIGRGIKRRMALSITPSCADTAGGPCVQAMHREIRRRVWKAVARLPRAMRRIIIAKHWLGMRSKQIAARLDIRVDAVDRLAFHARRRLSKELGLLRRQG